MQAAKSSREERMKRERGLWVGVKGGGGKSDRDSVVQGRRVVYILMLLVIRSAGFDQAGVCHAASDVAACL